MKIVQINCAASGSTGNIAKAIHRRLLDEGHDSYIFYGCGSTNETNMFRIGNDVELHAHSFLSRNLGKQGYFSHLATCRLIRRLKKISPDIIHLHNLHGSYLNLPMLFGYLKGTQARLVITLHDCWLFTGKCPHFTAVGCEKWKSACGDCPQLPIYPRSKVDTTRKSLQDKKKWLSGFGDRLEIIAVSNWLRDEAKRSYLSQYTIKTIHNGIDTAVFYPRETAGIQRKYGLGDKYVILGVASSWDERKGLKAFLELSKELGADDVIVLVGLTDKQILSLPSKVIGITRTEDQNELAELYSAADVFVNTSKEETFGLVTAEAMACGTPVIVYDSTACAEIVKEDDGMILDPNREQGLKDAIDQLRQYPKKTVNTDFNIEKMVRGYMDAYKSKRDDE